MNPMTGGYRTGFADLGSLVELPWFDLQGSRLLLDPACGPVIDIHTHLSLSYLLRSTVNQDLRTDRVQCYLPEQGRPVDLAPYCNRNFTTRDLRRMKLDLVAGSFLPGIGPRQTHTAANLVSRMQSLCISHAAIHAVDLPFISRNSELYLEQARRHPQLLPFGSVHPSMPFAGRRVDRLARAGVRGMKVHPAVQGVRADDARQRPIYEACRRQGLPVLWHCGPVGIEPAKSRQLSLVRNYELPLAEFPEVTFILGHAGALQYREAMELAQRYPNAILDLSCQGLVATRAILAAVDQDRVVFGSDWPFYNQAIGIAKVLIATEGDAELRRKVLHDNAARILKPGSEWGVGVGSDQAFSSDIRGIGHGRVGRGGGQ
jgi:predicted TIM-barrel fold metal-dependent hydrolase